MKNERIVRFYIQNLMSLKHRDDLGQRSLLEKSENKLWQNLTWRCVLWVLDVPMSINPNYVKMLVMLIIQSDED